MHEEKNYKYYAFISYSRRDIDEAKWFQKKLEHFHIPTKLPRPADAEPIPRPIRLFRDKTDLDVKPVPFSENLQKAIEESKYLIVLCSPNASKSSQDGKHYINWEIQDFIEKHGKEYAKTHILPVILDGEVNSGNPETECLPSEIISLGDEFLKHNFPVLEKIDNKKEINQLQTQLILQTLSFLLDVEYNVLNDRYQQEQKKKYWLITSFALVLVGVFAALSIWAITERNITRKTLAKSYEREAMELFEQKQTDYALAYFDQSLKTYNNPATLQLLYNTITSRSWLIEQDTNDVIPKQTKDSFKFSIMDNAFPESDKVQLRDNTILDLNNIDTSIKVYSSEDSDKVIEIPIKKGFEWNGFLLDENEEYLISAQVSQSSFYKEKGNHTDVLNFKEKEYFIQIWSVKTTKIVAEYTGTGILWDLVISPDGYHIAYCINSGKSNDYILNIKSVDGKTKNWSYQLTDFRRCMFSPDGRNLIIESEEEIPGKLTLLNVYRPNSILYSTSIDTPIKDWVFSNDGRRLAISTSNNEICLVNVRNGEETVERRKLESAIGQIAFTSDDKGILVKTSELTKCYIIQINPKLNSSITPDDPFIFKKVFSNDSKSIIASVMTNKDEYYLQLNDLSKEDQTKFKLNYNPVGGAFSTDDSKICLYYDNFLNIYKTPTASKNTLGDPNVFELPFEIGKIKFSPDSKTILAQSIDTKSSIVAINLQNKHLVQIDRDSNINDVGFLSDGTIVLATFDDTVSLWNQENGACIWEKKIETKGQFFSCLNVSKRDLIICGLTSLTKTDGSILILDYKKDSFKKINRLQGGVSKLVLAKDETLLGAAYMTGSAQVFDLKTGYPRTRALPQGNTNGNKVLDINFVTNKDITYLATCGETTSGNGFIDIWNIETSKKVCDTLNNAEKYFNIFPTSNGVLISWTYKEIMSLFNFANIGNDIISIEDAKILGGWHLNKFQIPEKQYDTKNSTHKIKQSQVIQWLNDFSDKRSLTPKSNETISDYIIVLDNSGSFEEVLDIDPEYYPSIANHWFNATFQIQKNLHDENDPSFYENYWALFCNDIESVRYADYLTKNVIQKYSNFDKSWYERGLYLSRIGKTNEAIIHLNKALEIDSQNIQSLLFKIDLIDDKNSILEDNTQIIANSVLSVDELCDFCTSYLVYYCFENGSNNLKDKVDWVITQLQNKLPEELSFPEQSKLLLFCEKITSVLQYIPNCTEDINRLMTCMYQLLSQKDSINTSTLDTIQINIAWVELLAGNYSQAEKVFTTQSSGGNQITALVNLAHCKAFIGDNKKALTYYNQLLDYDDKTFIISPLLVNDLILFRILGNPLPCEEIIRERVFANVKKSTLYGMRIKTVLANGQAADIGLKSDDILISYGGYPVLNTNSFSYARQTDKFRSDNRMKKIEVLRQGKVLTFTVKPGLLGIMTE